MTKSLPPRRYTSSREAYWRDMFNDLSGEKADYAVSGWSPRGLSLRMEAYLGMLPTFNLPPAARVLDLGCGAGAYSRVLAESGLRVVGVDYAWRVAVQARQRTTPVTVDFLSADATCLPFSDARFDHVVCVGLFQSLQRHQRAMAEIFRVLRPGGALCLMTLNRRNLKNRLERRLGREDIIMVDGKPQPRLNTYDPDHFCADLAAVGFVDLQRQPVQIYPAWLEPCRGLVGLWSRIPFLTYLTARSFMVVAKTPG